MSSITLNMDMKFMKHPFIRLFFMDHLKLYKRNDKELEGLLFTVKQFSADIGMEFVLDKYAKATLRKSNITHTTAVEMDIEATIHEVDQVETYKYLGNDEGNGTQHSKMKEKLRKEGYRRAKAILKTELNLVNRIEVINICAINWILQDLKRIDTKIGKLLTCYKMHYPKVDKDQLYVPNLKGEKVSCKQN